MNVNTIRDELAARLRRVTEDAYAELPANPVFPCAIVSFPEVVNFHSDMAHEITRLQCEVRVYVGRGDLVETQRWLADFISTDTEISVLKALEAGEKTSAWHRLKVVSTSGLNSDGDALGVAFTLELDA
jgi:hypothetical protein